MNETAAKIFSISSMLRDDTASCLLILCSSLW